MRTPGLGAWPGTSNQKRQLQGKIADQDKCLDGWEASRLGDDVDRVLGCSQGHLEPAKEALLTQQVEGQGPRVTEPYRAFPRCFTKPQANATESRRRDETADRKARMVGPRKVDAGYFSYPAAEPVV
jgi:hypothetical protein